MRPIGSLTTDDTARCGTTRHRTTRPGTGADPRAERTTGRSRGPNASGRRSSCGVDVNSHVAPTSSREHGPALGRPSARPMRRAKIPGRAHSCRRRPRPAPPSSGANARRSTSSTLRSRGLDPALIQTPTDVEVVAGGTDELAVGRTVRVWHAGGQLDNVTVIVDAFCGRRAAEAPVGRQVRACLYPVCGDFEGTCTARHHPGGGGRLGALLPPGCLTGLSRKATVALHQRLPSARRR